MGNYEGRTVTELTRQVDVTVPDDDEVMIVMTGSQADKLVELLDRHIDIDVVSLDNDDAEGALFVEQLIETIRSEREIARDAAEASGD